VTTAELPDTPQARPGAATAAQARIISAAIHLFARHGVAGTSLQMIADELGITKAAVYHHYKTKEQIVLAAAEAELALMEATIDDAEEEQSWLAARERLLLNMVNLAVERRHTIGTVLADPASSILSRRARHSGVSWGE
jgi:AcrR family transcriptional regulator